MSAQRAPLLFILALLFVFSVTAQEISLQVYVHDDYTDVPLNSALVAVLKNGEVISSSYTGPDGIAGLSFSTVSVYEPEGMPSSMSLSFNYPNPFKNETSVHIGVTEAQTITAAVYNILGQLIISERMPVSSGYHTLHMSLGSQPKGLYFLRIEGNESKAVKLLKIESGVGAYCPVFKLSSLSEKPSFSELHKPTEEGYMLSVVKENYETYSAPLEVTGITVITVPLARNNTIEFTMVEGADQPADMEIGINGAGYSYTTALPQTIILRSGLYTLTGEIDEGITHEVQIEIPSVDLTVAWPFITDIDGNIYKTVKIGDQWWMAENLKVSKYRDGIEIPNETVNDRWSRPIGLWSHYNNDTSNDETYGKLYTWHAVADTSGLCPPGWHVPTDEEWKHFEIYLGLTQAQADELSWRGFNPGGKLKSTSTLPDENPGWTRPNIGATNETGFSGLPGGYRSWNGWFSSLEDRAGWWTSTNYLADQAYWRSLRYDYGAIARFYDSKAFGFSVRCMRD